MIRTALAMAFLALAAPPPAAAADCDCSRRVGLCQAEASHDGVRIWFTSQTEQCSRISFSVDQQPASITISDGRGSARFRSLAPDGRASVSVDACFVCDVRASR